MTSATNYESYFQIWKYSGKSLSLFCKEQNLVYISFRDFLIENHVDEYNAYNAERIARNTLSEEEEARCGVAYGIKNDYPERSIKECCEEAGIDRQKFDAWLKRSGKSVKPACIARSEGMYEDLMDPNNKLSVSALLQKHRLTKKKFLEWADIEGVMLPKGLRQTSVIEDQMESKYKKFVASGKSLDDFCKDEKVNKALLSAYIDKYHPEEETDETTTKDTTVWEQPVPKTPIIKAVAEEAGLEVVEKPSEVSMSQHDDKVEDIKKKLLDAVDELSNLCAPEPEKVSNNMKELTALVAASGGIKNEDVFVISGTFVKELMNMDRNFKELQSFKDNLKNMLR